MVWGFPWGAEELILWPYSTIDILRDFVQVVCVCMLVAQSCPDSLQPRELGPSRILCPWNSPGKVKALSHVWLFATPWTVACQAPPSMWFYRQEYWSGLPFPSPGDLPDLGIKSGSSTLQTLPSEPPGKPKNTGVGSHSFLLRVSPTKGLNLVLLHGRQILYHLHHQRSQPLGFRDSVCFCFYLKRSFGEGNGNPLQYSCLENPMDWGAW